MSLGVLATQTPVCAPRSQRSSAVATPSFRGANQQQLVLSRPYGKCLRAAPRRTAVVARATAASDAISTVRMSVQGRHLEVTPAIQEYVQTRISKAVSNFEGGVKEVSVRLSVGGGDRGAGAPRQRAEITVYTLRNGVVRAEDEEDKLYAAIDLVSDKLTRRLRKMKEKAIDRGKWQGSGGPKGAKVISELIDWEDAQYNFPLDRKVVLPDDVLRTKTFVLHPTTLEQATEQLEQVGHDFFLYMDKETEEIRVLYKRNHGGLGLIVPQLIKKQK